MIDLDSVTYRQKPILNKETILSRTTQKAIIEHYIKQRIDFSNPICSPLREDRHPSFSFIAYNNGVVMWRDWGTGEHGDAFDLVMYLRNNCTFIEALQCIDQDMHLGISNESYTPMEKQILAGAYTKDITPIKQKKVITITQRVFNRHDYNFWRGYGITLNTLKKYDVEAVENVYIDGKYKFTSSTSRPSYAYYFNHEHTNPIKIYSPFNKIKWLFDGTQDDIDGWLQLPEKVDNLIITKSRKDVMLLYELGYYSISQQSEVYGMSKGFADELYTRAKNIYIWYDNDRTGKENAQLLSDAYGFKSITTESSEKDPSDFFKRFGKDATKKLISKWF